jgi:hypothetical protein
MGPHPAFGTPEDGTLLTDIIAWAFEELRSISDEQIRNHIKQMGAGRI